MADTEDTVKLSYSAWSNISFRGTIDTGIDRAEWNEMSQQERNEVITEELFNLVDIGEEEA